MVPGREVKVVFEWPVPANIERVVWSLEQELDPAWKLSVLTETATRWVADYSYVLHEPLSLGRVVVRDFGERRIQIEVTSASGATDVSVRHLLEMALRAGRDGDSEREFAATSASLMQQLGSLGVT